MHKKNSVSGHVVHPHNLSRVSRLHCTISNDPVSGQRRPSSDSADSQGDLAQQNAASGRVTVAQSSATFLDTSTGHQMNIEFVG